MLYGIVYALIYLISPNNVSPMRQKFPEVTKSWADEKFTAIYEISKKGIKVRVQYLSIYTSATCKLA